MKKWKLWAGLTAIFLSGVLIGALGAGIEARRSFDHLFAPGHSAARELVVKRLTRDLELSQSQRTHVEHVICKTHKELHELRLRHKPEIEVVIRAALAEIKEQLTSEQSSKLDALYAQIQQRFNDRRKVAPDCN